MVPASRFRARMPGMDRELRLKNTDLLVAVRTPGADPHAPSTYLRITATGWAEFEERRTDQPARRAVHHFTHAELDFLRPALSAVRTCDASALSPRSAAGDAKKPDEVPRRLVLLHDGGGVRHVECGVESGVDGSAAARAFETLWRFAHASFYAPASASRPPPSVTPS
jgi:hypothetical protein